MRNLNSAISLIVIDKEEKHDQDKIDNTNGKTRIGNSYYGWSMNYPSWMIVGRGTDDESGSAFNDATGRYYLEVHASSQKAKLIPDDLLERLLTEVSDSGDVVLHQVIRIVRSMAWRLLPRRSNKW